MKKTLALLLTLCLLLSACGPAAQPTSPSAAPEQTTATTPQSTAAPTNPTEAPTTAVQPTEPPEPPAPDLSVFPSVGDEVYGFKVVEIREFPMLGANIARFEHIRTGGELFYIANDDTNRIFDLTFFTRAEDNTGLPHVFEHSTLDGSKKYPSKSLFFNLIYQTYNTYMNANTGKKQTNYPVASLSEAQLLKYADLYTDSCFYPMIMEDESIFKEEAWRYRMADADSPLTIEGTVYSEMLGATTLARMSSTNFYRTTFPGSVMGNDSGGDPEVIPTMTWQMLKDYHDLYYHPSNCAAYLYGSFEDYSEFLKLLDEAYEPFERREYVYTDEGYTALTESVEVSLPFPVEAGSKTDHASYAYYAILCPGLKDDPNEEMILNTLTDLMIDSGSILQLKLKAALPYATCGCYIEEDAPDDAIVFYAVNINPEDGSVFKSTVNEALAEIAEKGFSQELVDSIMASLSISLLLARETTGADFVDDIFLNLPNTYASTGRPWDYPDYVEALGKMDEWNQQGLYTQAVSKWLLGDDKITALTLTYPEPGEKEKNDAALAARLAEVKAAMSAEEIAAIVEASNQTPETEDTSEMVKSLQAVTVESLPEEVKEYEVRDETDADGIRHVDVVAAVDGIGQPNLFLDAAGLTFDQLQWFKLFTSLIGELDTDLYTYEELQTLIGRYLNSFTVNVSLLGTNDDYHSYLRIRWTALDEDLEKGYELAKNLIFGSDLNNPQKILETVQALKANLKSSITSSPYNTLLYRALSVSHKLYRYYCYLNFVDYYQFLEEAEQKLTDDPEYVVNKLQGIQAYFNNRMNAMTLFAGNEESIRVNRPLADAFLASLDKKDIKARSFSFVAPMKSEGLIVESSVQYNLLVADFESVGLEEYDAGLDAITALVTDKILMPQLRDQYGAYSVFHGVLIDDGVYIISYRDPNVEETFDVYDSLYEQIKALEVDQETLNGYILSSYVGYAQSAGELSGALSAGLTVLQHLDSSETLLHMQQLKAVTPEAIAKYAEIYKKLSESGIRSTAGSSSAIKDRSDRFKTILNPFGVEDAALEDLPGEDDPYYEAITFMIDNGILKGVSSTSFAPDAPATNADMMASLYVLVGGGYDAAEAVQFFSGYGLVSADIDLAAPLACEELFPLLEELGGVTYPNPTGKDSLTRAEYAQAIYDFLEAIQ